MTNCEVVPGRGIEGWVIPHCDCLLGAYIEVELIKGENIRGYNLGIRDFRTDDPRLFVLQSDALCQLPLSEINPDVFYGIVTPEGQEYVLPEFVGWYYESPPETHLVHYKPECWDGYYYLPNGETDHAKRDKQMIGYRNAQAYSSKQPAS